MLMNSYILMLYLSILSNTFILMTLEKTF